MILRQLFFIFSILLGILPVKSEDTTTGNVLFIMIDDMRAFEFDQIAITPNIDSLRKESTTYNFAYCQESMCNPSRSSILSGLRPDSTRIHNSLTNKLRQFLPEVVTLPQTFREQGYTTISLGKIFHHNDRPSWDQTSSPREETDLVGGYYLSENIQLFEESGRGKPYENVNVPDSVYRDGWYAYQACEALENFSNNNEAFFLAVGFQKPHLPYTAPTKYWDMYDPSEIDRYLDQTPANIPENSPSWTTSGLVEINSYNGVPARFEDLHPDSLTLYRHGYYACLSFVDHLVGEMIRKLKEVKLFDNTTIVIVSDHGYKLGEYQSWSKLTNFEIDNKVPLLIKYPSQKTPEEDNRIVELIDIYPTLCKINGLKWPENLEGKDLSSRPEKMFAISQFVKNKYSGYSIRTEAYRYTGWESNGIVVTEELFDKTEGLYEWKNIATDPQYSEALKQMRTVYDSIRGTSIGKDPDLLDQLLITTENKRLKMELPVYLNQLTLVMHDLNGRIVYEKSFSGGNVFETDLPNFKGILILKVVSGNLIPKTAKFYVQ